MSATVLWSGQHGPLAHVSSILGTTAAVAHSAGQAAVLVMDTGAGFTASATTAVIAITSSSLSAIENAWRGVDLSDVVIVKTFGRVVADNGQVLEHWVNSNAGIATTQSDLPAAIELWSALVASVELQLPYVSARVDRFEANSRYWRAEGSASMLHSGHTALEFCFTHVSFRPIWANPLWQSLDLNISVEHAQIMLAVGKADNYTKGHNVTWGPILATANAVGDVWAVWLARLGRSLLFLPSSQPEG